MKDEELVENQPAKAKQRTWVKHERRYSNSLWHTGYKELPDGRYFIAYMNDASRLIVGFGIFDEQTAKNAILVLEDAIEKYGKPAGILTSHNPQFYASKKEVAERGVSEFEKKLVELGIRHLLVRVRSAYTNGKLRRFYLEIKQQLNSFELESAANTVRGVQADSHVGNLFNTHGATDPLTRLVEWYNNLEHMSLKDMTETPTQAYIRKQPPKGTSAEEIKVAMDGQS